MNVADAVSSAAVVNPDWKLLGAIALQTLATVWYASRLVTKFEFLEKAVDHLRNTMEHEGFARCQLHDQKVAALEARVKVLEHRNENGKRL